MNLRVDGLSLDDAYTACMSSLETRTGLLVMGVNGDLANASFRDPDYASLLNQCDIVLADGVGGWLLARANGQHEAKRAPIPDLVDRLLTNIAGNSVFLAGGTPAVVADAAQSLQGRGIQLAGVRDGYLTCEEEEDLISLIVGLEPAIVLLGMPSPKKEKIGLALRSRTDALIIGVGGYIDILAGHIPRAPASMRRLGLEWTYRFAHEPRRLARRYVLGNAELLWRLSILLIRKLRRRGRGAIDT